MDRASRMASIASGIKRPSIWGTVVTLFLGLGAGMIFPSTPHNGWFIIVMALAIFFIFVFWDCVSSRAKKDKPLSKKGIIIVFSVLTLILIGSCTQLKFKQESIIIQPQEVALNTSPWLPISYFTVSNVTDNTIFDIWIRFTLENCSVQPTAVIVGMPNVDSTYWVSTGDISVAYDGVILYGHNLQNQTVLYLIIHHLQPRESLQVAVDLEQGANLVVGEDASIEVKLIKQANKPVNLLKNKDELSYPFTLTEPFQLEGMRLEMRRQGEIK